MKQHSRRHFIASSLSTVATGGAFARRVPSAGADELSKVPAELSIDIHQHTLYKARNNAALIAHQRAMGVTQTILLPAGSSVIRDSTNQGRYNGLGGAGVGGNDTAFALAQEYPKEFLFGSNEVTDLPEARTAIESYLKRGAVIIGEQKFSVQCDSRESQRLYELAGEYHVPILLHFQHNTYNLGFEFFHKMLEKYPNTTFIGHAQTWWANIDKNHSDQTILYPKGPVTAGGMTDRYLSDYPNMFADMSAGSGLNALTRDEDHARGFLERHQEKILYGSDCDDHFGTGPKCQGARTIAAIRQLAPNKSIERKILYENAKQVFRIAN